MTICVFRINEMRDALIILGMHRSGTSATSGLFNMNGYDLGMSIMNANWSNPKGFYENFKINSFSNDLFQILHVNWHNTLGLNGQWWKDPKPDEIKKNLKELIESDYTKEGNLLFKDPRMCILLPLYNEVLVEMGFNVSFIITLRNPRAVARSLNRRDGFSYKKSIRIYMDYMIKAEQYTRGKKRCFVDYDSIITNPLQTILRLTNSLGIKIKITPEKEAQIIDFIELGLNHFEPDKLLTLDTENDEIQLFNIFKNAEFNDLNDNEGLQADNISRKFYKEYQKEQYSKISIITVVRQGSTDLKTTFRSISTSDYPDLEYIVIESDADPTTKEMCNHQTYLANVIFESGLSKKEAKELGMRMVSGKWVGFLDSGRSFISNHSLSDFISQLKQNDEQNICSIKFPTESGELRLFKTNKH